MENYNMSNMEGVDTDIEISLFEYGLAWIVSNDQKQIMFFYGIGFDDDLQCYDLFDSCSFNVDMDVCVEFDWADFDDLFSYAGVSKTEWNSLTLMSKICDLVRYYGYSSVFGESYYGGMIYNANINRFHSPKD